MKYILFPLLLFSFACTDKKTENKALDSSNMLKTNNVAVYNFSDSIEFQQFIALELDKTHANLLNPQVSKDSINEVVAEWTKYHQSLGAHLAQNNFEWGVQDSLVKVFHKIYFTEGGQVKHHFFNVFNQDMSAEKKDEFSKQIKAFDENVKLDLNRQSPFAQCGKASYQNL